MKKLVFDDMAAARLADEVRKRKRPGGVIVVAVVGGSASGKTTLAERLVQLFGDDAVLFQQDVFQQGSDFSEKRTSPYKWDDPKNFDIPRSTEALAKLKQGERVIVPDFDVVLNKRRHDKEFAPHPIIIWEGIYAVHSKELRDMVDMTIYCEAPFILRLLRRIVRHLDRESVSDITVPAKQMLTFVNRAHDEFVAVQRKFADFVVSAPAQEIDATIQRLEGLSPSFSVEIAEQLRRAGDEPSRQYRYDDIVLRISEHALVITKQSKALYAAHFMPQVDVDGIILTKN